MKIRRLTVLALLACFIAMMAMPAARAFGDDVDNSTSDPDGAIALSERLSALAHQILRSKDAPADAMGLDAALYRAAIRLNPSEPRFLRAYADLLLEMNDIPGALDALKQYRDLDRDDQTAQVQYIDLYLASDQMESLSDRLHYLRYLLQVQGIPDPVKSVIALRAANLYMERGQNDEAMKLLDSARHLNPLNLDALRIRYVLTQAKAVPLDRVTQLLAILQANPADPVVASRLAEQLAQLGLVEPSVLWYGVANTLYNKTAAKADPAFILGASSQLLLAKKPDEAEALAVKYTDALPEDADGWFTCLSVYRYLLNQFGGDKQAQAKYDATLHKAGIAIANSLMDIRHSAGDSSATTRPVDSPDDTVLPDLSGDPDLLKAPQLRELVGPYLATLSSLAWLDLYYKHDAAAAVPLIDDLARLAPEGDPTVKRLRAWQEFINHDSKGALPKLKALGASDPLAQLGVVLIELQDPNVAPRAVVHAQKLLDDHPSGVVGAVIWSEFSHLGIKIDPAPDAAAVATLVSNVPDSFEALIGDPRSFYDVEVTPLKPNYIFGEPILVRVTMQNISNVNLAVGDDCAVHPELWFDARFRGNLNQNVPGAAVGRLDQRLVLGPGDSVSTIVRIDQDSLYPYFNSNPANNLMLDLSVVLNPSGIAATQGGMYAAQPGICGYAVPASELIARQAMGVMTPVQRTGLYDMLNADDGGAKIMAMNTLAAYVMLIVNSKTQDDSTNQIKDEFVAKLHRVDPEGHDPVIAMQKLNLTLIAQGSDQTDDLTDMALDSHWQTRLLALTLAGQFKDLGTTIADRLSSDSDPIVKAYAISLATSLKAAAATQPSASPPEQTSQTPQ
jgi:tetratricopeptide (TPR) repeat protein